jgi:xanthine dehydrogenase molybdenum-binding subunit
MAYRLVGKDFTPPDIAAKVTGAAKYVEDFRREGMVFARVIRSAMPHARIRNIDTADALKVPGVIGVLLPTEVPHFPEPEFPILTDTPRHVGAPILAIAAVDEWAAAEAAEKVKITYEARPFVVDALDSLFPGSPNAHEKGNIFSARIDLQELKWTARDFGAVDDGQLPLGKAADEWKYGDVEAGFAKAKLVIDESYVTGGLPHHCMEPRSSFAYWENGKLFVHGSSQSQAAVVVSLARLAGVDPKDLHYIAEFCGGGFGSKIGGYPAMAMAAHFSKKLNRPVLVRLGRNEEAFEGTGRPAFQGRFKVGFAANGRVTAVDMYVIQDGGSVSGGGDFRSAGNAVSLLYTPAARSVARARTRSRWRSSRCSTRRRASWASTGWRSASSTPRTARRRSAPSRPA